MRAAVQFLAIARLAALESIRRPVFLLVSLFVLASIVLLPFLLNFTLGESARIIRDSALALHFTGGLLLAAVAAGEALSRELRRGTAGAVLSKPVPRALFFLAKSAGIAVALLLYSVAALAATLLAVRAGANSEIRLDWTAAGPALAAVLLAPALAGWWNHRTRRPFTSAAFTLLLLFLLLAIAIAAGFATPLEHLVFPANFAWGILRVGYLLTLCLGMAAALAAALATRLAVTPVLLLGLGLFLFGLMGDYLLGPRLDTAVAARAAYALLPNAQAFWLLDALDGANPVSATYLLRATAYAGAWSAGVLALGLFSFRQLEVS